jgi:hypothetical protein
LALNIPQIVPKCNKKRHSVYPIGVRQ